MKYNPRDPKRMKRIRETSQFFKMMPQYDHTRPYFEKFSLLRHYPIRESNRTRPLPTREIPEVRRFYEYGGRRHFERFTLLKHVRIGERNSTGCLV